MKKFYFSLVVALLFSVSALANNVIVKGYVTYSNGSPVVNHNVWIMTDSLTTSTACMQAHQVHTNANGFYIDSLNCPNGSIVKVRIQTENCNGTYIVENPQVNTATNIVERNFMLACNPQCNADFVFTKQNLTAAFTSTSTVSGSTPISFYWNFGDAGTATIANPVHTYGAAGTYNVTLFISSNGCTDTVVKSITLVNAGGTCHAQFTDSMIAPNKFIFNSTGSTTASGDQIVNHIWTFGDGTGNTGNQVVVDHIYQQGGTYNVCLRIVSANGCVDSTCKTFAVTIPTACVSQFSFQRLNTTPGYNVAFNSSASSGSTPVDAIVSRLWTFGDGQQLTGNVVSPTHMYTAQGNYTVCLRIETVAGCIKTECKLVSLVDSNNCHANFSFAIGSGGAVMFTNTSSTTGTAAQYVWSFGTLATSSAINPVYTFAPGTYNVCLRIYSGNCMDSVCKTVVIAPAPTHCEAVFQYTGLPAGTNGYTLQFTSAQSHGTSAANDTIHERIWIWGDGSTTGGNVIAPTHTYHTAAVYNVCLVIRTSGGCSDTTCKTVTVPMPNQLTCKSQFTYEHLPATSATGRSVRFNSSTSAAGYGDSIISRKWTFGDGTSLLTGNVVSPVHVYAQPGTYSACLTITTALGCTKTECKVVVVPQVAGNCVPHFTWTRTGPKQASFNSSSSWAPANDSIIERKWQFGDASPLLAGNIVSPVHNYQYNGIYTVTLKIRTALNCEKTFYGVVPLQDSINVNPNQDRIKIVSLYPTPATYQMQAVVWSLQNNIQAELAVYDIYGTKKWSTNKVLFQGNNVTLVSTGFLAPGPYYFRVTTIYGVKSKPFFKQ
jgi:PKD repeat protein